jgi:hypothetical protein
LSDGAAKAVIVGDYLTRRKHEVIANRRMGGGIVLRGQAMLLGQTVQVGHRRIANHAGIAVIFLEHNEDVITGWNRACE